MKTNKKWYAYEDMGSYYKLEDDILLGCPMLINGEREDNDFVVEYIEEQDKDRMNSIVIDLNNKE
jgi:hypothetical protein